MSTSRKYPAVFLDRDGVINEEVGYVDDLQKLRLIPCAYQAIQLINQSGLKAVVVSNQAGVAKGILSEKWVRQTNQYLDNLLRQRGAFISKFYFCPHHPTEGIEPYRKICDCRKPAPGMFLKAARELNIDLSRSYMIGDRFWDVEAAKKVCAKGILVKTGYGSQLLQEDGPNTPSENVNPDFIAENILEAVQWILRNRT
jgi:D,D-heptose 1,7-bisphosphate phosphatase